VKWATPEIGSTTMTIRSDWPVSLSVSRYGLAARLYLRTRDTCAECIAETTTEEGPDEDIAARACAWADSIIGTAELRERVYARSCLRCGLDEGLGENRLCATCCPPAPWWASILRTVDERALLLRLVRRVNRFMARCAGGGML